MNNRLTKCKIKAEGCEVTYTKWSISQKCCKNIACAIELMRQEKTRKARKSHLEAKVKARPRGEWLKLAHSAFNAFIRARDKNQPCICCGEPLALVKYGGSYDCGHYRSVGSAPHLRFDERNAHAQRKQCNRWGSGRAVDYRLGLIARIGLEEVESLESDNTVRKYTITELQEIISLYRKKLKELV